MQHLSEIRTKILQEVKNAAAQIAATETVPGLISRYQTVQEILEKVAFLKLLNEEQIYFTQKEPEAEIAETVNPDHLRTEQAAQAEKTAVEAYDEGKTKEEAINLAETPVSETDKAASENAGNGTDGAETAEAEDPTDKADKSKDEISADSEHKTEEPTAVETGDAVEKTAGTENGKVKLASIRSLNGGKPAATQTDKPGFRLDLNDKMAFRKKLFNDDEQALNDTMQKLNTIESLEQAKEYLSDIYYERNWKEVDEYAQRLWSLVENRFR